MSQASDNPGFLRLAALLQAGYRFEGFSSGECVFLEHPAGRRFKHWRAMVYDNGTVCGAGDYRIRSDDDDGFSAFLRVIPRP